jgi:HEAT repeat protein
MEHMTSRKSAACWLALIILPSAVAFAADTPKQQAWGILKTELSDKGAHKRAQAVRVLGLLPGDTEARKIAEGDLDDKEPSVRAAASTALGQMGSKSSIPLLRKALQDQQVVVVLAAAHALKALDDPAAYEAFYAVLTGERKSGQGLVAEGMETLKDKKKLAQIGFEEGIGFIPFASIGYTAFRTLTKDDTSPVRAIAASILASDPDPRSGQALVKAASDKSWIVRAAALEAIAKRHDPQLLDDIVPELFDKNQAVRCTAAAAVIRLSSNPKPKK